MCKYVKADFYSIDFKKEAWFTEYTWTEEQEQKFVNWLTRYMMRSKGARQAIMNYPIKNRDTIKKAAELFCSWYGWKTEVKQEDLKEVNFE